MSETARTLPLAISTTWKVLRDHGFEKKASMFFRTVGECINIAWCYRMLPSPAVRLDMGFHYTWLVGMFSQKKIKSSEFTKVDAFLRSSADQFMSDRHRMGWEYSEDRRKAYCDDVESGAKMAARVFDECNERWRDARVFMDLIPPEVLPQEYDVDFRHTDMRCIMQVPQIQRLLPGWTPYVLDMAVFLAKLALRKGDKQLAKEYAKVGLTRGCAPDQRRMFERILRG